MADNTGRTQCEVLLLERLSNYCICLECNASTYRYNSETTNRAGLCLKMNSLTISWISDIA